MVLRQFIRFSDCTDTGDSTVYSTRCILFKRSMCFIEKYDVLKLHFTVDSLHIVFVFGKTPKQENCECILKKN